MADLIDAVLLRAARLTADGRPHAAVELLRPVITDHPDHSAAWCRLAAALLDTGALDESLAAAKQAISLGERSWAHRLASLVLVELGRYDEAVACAAESVRREPTDWRCHVALAEALGPGAAEEALTAARRAVALAPGEARPLEVLGDAAARMQDLSLARKAYREALRLDPGNVHVAASLDRLSSRTAPAPAAVAPLPVVPPAPFGRSERIAVWLLLRRAAGWQVAGALVLLLAGQPSPSPALIWPGFGLVLFVPGLAGHGWLRLPPGGRAALPAMLRVEPLAVVCGASLAVSVLLLAVWTVALSIGAGGMQLLGLALGGAIVALGLGWLGLWRLKVRAR
ncbi:MAG: tetratricopeptide repeat protein [Labedaea sp.]